ncbi:uncharacterized protein VTP21DRAFT_8905 [Calcarisporiella thermophila]|uniref:uncharacterized protein n=1 Tax=Calcarisporiella thermophila TaxID=911321 RepID=UPI0037436FED
MPDHPSEAYYTCQLTKLRQTIQSWRIRKLSLLGKVHLINSRLLSRIWYVATIIRPHEYFFKELDEIIRQFLWDGRGPQISLKLLAKSREEGGLGLILPRHQITALLASWIPKFAELLKRPNQDPKTPLWASILKHNLLSMYANRCNASRDTIRHTFFECPELTPVWQWAERCIVTITGPQNTPVLNARNLILGDLTESSRTARHVA